MSGDAVSKPGTDTHEAVIKYQPAGAGGPERGYLLQHREETAVTDDAKYIRR